MGIDAGGTYTDAVIVDMATQRVLAKGKALTTKDDLSRGVAAAIRTLPAAMLPEVRLVALSTTLATNAVVEGKGCKVGALLLGFDDYDLARIPHHPRRLVAGKTDITGREVTPLDEDALRAAARDLLEREGVDALAVSGMTSVKNPTHEIRARRILSELTDKPVVCAHELTMQLDAIKRTVTATINARLLPIIAELIAHVRTVMGTAGITAPLMVVRGDGTLMSEELARLTPVETILSGPAASICGARLLTGVRDGLVVDIGGTTSDIALLVEGNPMVATAGVRVADWSTNVRAIDVETVGLGGDSAVTLSRENKVIIGPRRAAPLAFLAQEYSAVLEEMARLWEERERRSSLIQPLEFYLRIKAPAGIDLTVHERRVLAALEDGPLSREQLAERTGAMDPSLVPVMRLETLGSLQRSTLTPTDILHTRGIFTAWSREAAELGLKIFAYRASVTPERLAEFILDTFSYWMTLHLMHRLLRQRGPLPDFPHGPADRALLDMLCDRETIHGLSLQAHFEHPLVAIGAPAAALAVDAAAKMGATLIIPEHAEVANAVGAISGTLTIAVEATITPNDDHFIVHTPVERRTFLELSAARRWAESHLLELLAEKVAQARVEGFTFHQDVRFYDDNGTTRAGHLFLESRVRAIAVGKPEFAGLAVG